jgi:hypothetical protein
MAAAWRIGHRSRWDPTQPMPRTVFWRIARVQQAKLRLRRVRERIGLFDVSSTFLTSSQFFIEVIHSRSKVLFLTGAQIAARYLACGATISEIRPMAVHVPERGDNQSQHAPWRVKYANCSHDQYLARTLEKRKCQHSAKLDFCFEGGSLMAIDTDVRRGGNFVIKGGAVITVDPNIGTLPKADVLVRDGAITKIGNDLNETDIEIVCRQNISDIRFGN